MQTQLPKVELWILKMLWAELHSGRGFGLIRKQIFKEFQKNIVEAGPLVRTDSALRVHLRLLVQRKPSLVVVRKWKRMNPAVSPTTLCNRSQQHHYMAINRQYACGA